MPITYFSHLITNHNSQLKGHVEGLMMNSNLSSERQTLYPKNVYSLGTHELAVSITIIGNLNFGQLFPIMSPKALYILFGHFY